MGQPNPPGDMPLIEGLGTEWNDIVSGFSEEDRAKYGPMIKERVSAYEPLKAWEDLHKSGITPDQAGLALNVFSAIENNPRDVLNTLASHLNVSIAEAKEIVEATKETQKEIDKGDPSDPRIQKLQQQVDTMAQILVAKNQQETQMSQQAEADKQLDTEMNSLKKKYGSENVDEEQVVMRMLHKGLTAEQAYQEHSGYVSEVRKTRPAPHILGAGGAIPAKQVDVTKLDNKDTKSIVTQMLQHANREAKQ